MFGTYIFIESVLYICLQVITSDGAVIEIGADVYFTVKDAIKSIVKIQDLNHSLRVLCHTAIPNHLGKRKVSEIEQDRNSVNYSLSVY